MRHAFTVIEVIVTFVILSILIFFAIYAFRYSVSNVQHALYYLPKTSALFSLLDRTLSGTYFYEVERKEKEFVEYFHADEKSIQFITVAPPYRDRLSLVKLEYTGQKLILQYEPLFQSHTKRNRFHFSAHSHKLILQDQIQWMHFSYILRDTQTTSRVSDQIPQGIVIDFKHRSDTIQWIFTPMSNFKENKARIFHAKYQI